MAPGAYTERKQKQSSGMVYAEIKGRSGGAKGCTEWALSRGESPSTTARRASRTDDDTVYSPQKYRETEGIKDIKPPTGQTKVKVLKKQAGIKPAELREFRDGDTVFYNVRTASSKPQVVTYTGTPTITGDGRKTYSFSGKSSGLMNVYSTAGGATVENKNYSGRYRVSYNVSSASVFGHPVYVKTQAGTYVKQNETFYTNYHKSTLVVTGVDTGSGSATLDFTPLGQTVDAGSVTVTPYTPETVVKRVLQPAELIPEEVDEIEGTTITVLAQTVTPVQNFAFDGMDDLDEIYEI